MKVILIILFLPAALGETNLTYLDLIGKLVSEFADCHVDIFEPANIHLDLSGLALNIPTTRLVEGKSLERATRGLDNDKFRRKGNCELILDTMSTTGSSISNLQEKFTWLTHCEEFIFSIQRNPLHRPLCYYQYSYHIVLNAHIDNYYPGLNPTIQVYQLNIMQLQNLEIRLISRLFCGGLSYKVTVKTPIHNDVSLKGFLKNAEIILLEHPGICLWEIGSPLHGVINRNSTEELNSERKKLVEIVQGVFRPEKAYEPGPNFQMGLIKHDQGYNVPMFLFPSAPMTNFVSSLGISARVLRNRISFNLVSCCETQPFVAFKIYADPFQTIVWIGVLWLTITSMVFLMKYNTYVGSRDGVPLLLARLVFEQEIKLDAPKLKKKYMLRLFCLFLCFMWLIFVNAYRSIVIMQISAPPPSSKIQRIVEALENNFKILVRYSDALEPSSIIYQYYNDSGYFTTRNRMILALRMMNGNTFVSRIKDLAGTPTEREMNTNGKIIMRLVDEIIVRHPAEHNALAVSEFDSCNKSVLVGEESDLYQFVKSGLKRGKTKHKIYYGTDSFLPENMYVIISGLHWDKSQVINRRMQCFLHSGIIHYLLNEGKFKVNEENGADIPMSIHMESNILSIFLIFCLSLGSALVVFISECIDSVFKMFGKLLNTRWKIFCTTPNSFEIDCKQWSRNAHGKC